MNDHLVVKILTTRPYNVYNIFFILERARLIQTCAEVTAVGKTPEIDQSTSSCDVAGFDLLCLPDLPPRYHGVHLPPDWYVPGKNAKRKHVSKHGCE